MREKVYQKYGGRCAYCGEAISLKWMHIDHKSPLFRGWDKKPDHAGADDMDNLMPSCAPCNLWKKTLTIDQFRHEIELQIERLRRDSAAFRMIERYGLVAATGNQVKFWFERYQSSQRNGK